MSVDIYKTCCLKDTKIILSRKSLICSRRGLVMSVTLAPAEY